MPLSSEALEDLATRVRVWAMRRERARLDGTAPPLVARVDPSPLVAAYPSLRTTDPVLATWLAEAVTRASLDAADESYAATWRDEPIALRGESPIDVRSLAMAMALEPNEHRRASVMHAADEKALEHLDAARKVVDAYRDTATERLKLGDASALFAALGWGEPSMIARAAQAVLDATDDVFREADAWLRSKLGLSRGGELSWSDRLRVRASVRSSESVPLGDRVGIASRWLIRCGLEGAVQTVRDTTNAPAANGAGVIAWIDEPGARASVIGTPARTVHGVVSLIAATAQAALSCTAREPRMCERAGVDRVHGPMAFVLGRRLFLEPAFLEREAGVDRGVSASLAIESVYDELWTARLEAARALFALDVLVRANDLAPRFREHIVRAVGSPPAPAWAAHEATHWSLESPAARTLANVLEPQLRETLRDRYDEDWFRNPRCGEALQDRFAAMRAHGTVAAWAKTRGVEEPMAVLTGEALARRMREAFG